MTNSAHKDEQTSGKTTKGRRSHEPEEECQDKVCSDTKSSINRWLKTKRNLPAAEPECPLDRNSLGKATWSVLHTIAAKYPVKPNQEEKTNMREFIRLISILYPCSYCAKEFRQDIAQLPPRLDSREALSQWFCQMHNRVNEKLNKPQFDCSKVDERWRTGWKDGSCLEL